MDALDYLILAAVAVLFVLCARHAFKNRNHACGGGTNCSGCPYRGSCAGGRPGPGCRRNRGK